MHVSMEVTILLWLRSVPPFEPVTTLDSLVEQTISGQLHLISANQDRSVECCLGQNQGRQDRSAETSLQ
jgi:hypothetical protein